MNTSEPQEMELERCREQRKKLISRITEQDREIERLRTEEDHQRDCAVRWHDKFLKSEACVRKLEVEREFYLLQNKDFEEANTSMGKKMIKLLEGLRKIADNLDTPISIAKIARGLIPEKT